MSIQYKVWKMRTAGNVEGTNKYLNELAKDGWIVEQFDDGWFVMAKFFSEEELKKLEKEEENVNN